MMNRRNFLQHAAGIGLAVASSRAWGRSLNERLNLGFIGLGGRGNELLKSFGQLPDIRIAALCDPDQGRLAKAAEMHRGAAQYVDLRKLLDDPAVDAVVIATCNHWHALAAIWACQAKKDVYVEKPLTHNHWEGQQVVRAARKHERIVQVGTQQRSDPLQDELKQYLHEEQSLGPIRYVQVSRIGTRAPIGKRTSPMQIPSDVDYDLWLGPAREEPIYRDNFHYDWHWDWNTGNGEMGNWGVHVLDDAVNVALLDKVAFPKRIAAAGGRVGWDDAGQTPNVGYVYYDTGTVPLLFALSNLPNANNRFNFNGIGTGYVIYFDGGYYAGGRGGGKAYDSSGKVVRRFKGDAGARHARNFVDAVFARDRSMLNAEVEIGHQSTAWCNLADVVMRCGHAYSHGDAAQLGQPAEAWAELVEKVEDHLASQDVDYAAELRLSQVFDFQDAEQLFAGEHAAEANRLLHREYRPQFEVPSIV